MTRTDYLNVLLVARSVSYGGSEDVVIEFRPFRGWYMCGEPRHLGDDGSEHIGNNWKEAEAWLDWLYPKK